MLSDYFTNMEKVDVFAMIAFFIFFIFFLAVTVHTLRLNKKKTQELGNIPLDDGIIDIETEFKE